MRLWPFPRTRGWSPSAHGCAEWRASRRKPDVKTKTRRAYASTLARERLDESAPNLLFLGRISFNPEATMFQSILVPLDGSKFAEQVLPVAAELARQSGAALHLVEVSHPVVVGSEIGAVAVVETRPPETIQAYLHEMAGR